MVLQCLHAFRSEVQSVSKARVAHKDAILQREKKLEMLNGYDMDGIDGQSLAYPGDEKISRYVF